MQRKDVARNILSREGGRRRVEVADIEEAFDGIDPDAHLSERQSKTALRINSILQERFEALVESENPPTATQLAEIGKKNRQRPLRDLGDRSPEEFAAATALTEIIEDFVRRAQASTSHSPCADVRKRNWRGCWHLGP